MSQLRAMVATLIDHFHLTLEEISLLTDWQIQQLYFHKRKKDGEIDADEAIPETYAADMLHTESVIALLHIEPEEADKLRRQIKQKWGKE